MKFTRKKPIFINIYMAISILITYSWIHEGYAVNIHKNNQKISAVIEKEKDTVTEEKTMPIYPVIDHIIFMGNTAFSEEKLKQVIPLRVGNLAEAGLIMSSMVQIAELYKEENTRVTITPILKKNTYNHVDLNFDIHEQKR